MSLRTTESIEITGGVPAHAARTLTSDALEFVAALHRRFNATRESLLALRRDRQRAFDEGTLPAARGSIIMIYATGGGATSAH